MSPAFLTSRQLYSLLKRDVARGRFAAGTQLPVGALARELGTSVQPVRDVLARLVGERMLELHPRAGFQVPQLSRRHLRDLVDWQAHLLRLVLRERRADWTMPDMTRVFVTPDDAPPVVAAEVAAALFDAIAERSDNAEHVDAIRSANARLQSVWLRDSSGMISLDELEAIATAAAGGRRGAMKDALWAYQRRQRRRLTRPSSARDS